jgi:hypothetical protein
MTYVVGAEVLTDIKMCHLWTDVGSKAWFVVKRARVGGLGLISLSSWFFTAQLVFVKVQDYVYMGVATSRPIAHPADGMWVNMEQQWNDIHRKTKALGENPVLMSTTNSMWTALVVSPGLFDEKPVTIHLNYDIIWYKW